MAFEFRHHAASGLTGLATSDEFAPATEQGYPGRLKTEMATTIGEKLRLARETRGIALHDISEQTRISMRYLQAIESDDYRRLPGGIFNRSFIRAYAKYIGYDEREALDEYAAAMHERGESTSETPNKQARSLVYTDSAGQRSPLRTVVLAIIILGALSFCVWGAWYLYEHKVRRKVVAPGRTSQTIAVDRNLITIQTEIRESHLRTMEVQNSKEDANELFA
jgi:cytoskeletal protein RodZ